MVKLYYRENVIFHFSREIHIDISSKTMKSFGFSGSWGKKKKKRKELKETIRTLFFFPS